MRNRRLAVLAGLAFLAGLAIPAAAQETTATHTFGIGPTNILDTYISQEKYKGVGLTYLYIRETVRPEKRWSSLIEHELDLSTADDRSNTTSEMEASYNLYWGRYRQWRLCGDRLRLQAGGLVNATLGFIYNMSAGNNPAQARVALNLMPSGVATYDFPLWRQPFSLRYELNLQLLGVMFSPNYGQSYYEIFSRGNYDHNIVATTPFSAPNLRHQLMVDCAVSSQLTLRVGYLGHYQQAKVNNLKSHIYNHRIMLGIVRTLRYANE